MLILSSSLTPFIRTMVPVVLLFIITISWVLAVLDESSVLAVLGLIPGTVVYFMICRFMIRIKTVHVVDGIAHAEGFGGSIDFTLPNIMDIKVVRGHGISFVRFKVRLKDAKTPAPLWFVPPFRLLGWSNGIHPTVLELIQVYEEAKGTNAES